MAQVHLPKVNATDAEAENNNETSDDTTNKNNIQVDLLSGSYENIPTIESTPINIFDTPIDTTNDHEKGLYFLNESCDMTTPN